MCNQVAIDALYVPNESVKNPFNITDADWHNAIWQATYKFWGDKNTATDDVVAELKSL
jgi:hypothetical protein